MRESINWQEINLKELSTESLKNALMEFGEISDAFPEDDGFGEPSRKALFRINEELRKRNNFDMWLKTQPLENWIKIYQEEIKQFHEALEKRDFNSEEWKTLHNLMVKVAGKMHKCYLNFEDKVISYYKKMEKFIPLTTRWLDYHDKIKAMKIALKG